MLGGRTRATIPPARTARGTRHQKRALHVDFSTNAAAKKGPMVLPMPTQEPRIP